MTTASLCESVIKRGTYKSKEDMQFRIDVFFAGARLTQEEYTELTDLLASK